MTDAERYIARAEQLERLAGEVTDAGHRLQLLDVAADWRGMAERAARDEARSWKPQRADRSA